MNDNATLNSNKPYGMGFSKAVINTTVRYIADADLKTHKQLIKLWFQGSQSCLNLVNSCHNF